MTDRADIVARITDKIQFITGIEPASLAHDKPLLGQSCIGSIDIADIEIGIEDEFAIGIGALDGLPVDWTINDIVDAVIAAKETVRT